MIPQLEKTVAESYLYDFDFSDYEAITKRAATITGVVSVTFTPADPALSVGAAAIDSPLVQVRIADGTDKTLYHGACIVQTDTGDTLEGHVHLYVADPD